MLVFCLAAMASAQSLDALDWLTGCWKTEAGAEECWLAPRGGLMVGVHRDVREGRPAFYEYLRIETVGEDLVYVASPKGQATTRFTLVQHGTTFVVFDNPTHDFPTRIRYERTADRLTATVSGTRRGKPSTATWTYRASSIQAD
ncbi:MAG: DUF6265 family protein [Myxococcota bacterium]